MSLRATFTWRALDDCPTLCFSCKLRITTSSDQYTKQDHTTTPPVRSYHVYITPSSSHLPPRSRVDCTITHVEVTIYVVNDLDLIQIDNQLSLLNLIGFYVPPEHNFFFEMFHNFDPLPDMGGLAISLHYTPSPFNHIQQSLFKLTSQPAYVFGLYPPVLISDMRAPHSIHSIT